MALVGLVTLAMVGCSGDEHPAPAPYEGSAAPATAASSTERTPGKTATTDTSCEDGQVRECHVVLGAQGSVQNCFVGLQLCTNGQWGDCVDPSELDAELSRG
jgi:hypothetical protein